MKKLLFTIILAGMIALNSYAQTEQPPNGGFENWNTNLLSSNLNGWNNTGLWAPGSFTKTSDAFSGSYAVKLQSIINGSDTAWGSFYNFTLSGPPPWQGGMPFTQRPDSMTGYYKYDIAPGDEAIIYITFVRFDTTTGSDSTIGVGISQITGTQSAYTKFSIPITYYDTTSPERVQIIISCSNIFVEYADPNSFMYIDNIGFTGSGITDTITNPDFEYWTDIFYTDPVDWQSMNIFKIWGLPDMVFKDSINVNSGNYALKVISDTAVVLPPFGNGSLDTVTGMVLLYGDMMSGGDPFEASGMPFTSRPDSVRFYVMGTVMAPDEPFIAVVLYKWDTVSMVREEIADNYYSLTSDTSSYMEITVPFNYYSSDDPDTMLLAVIAGDPGGMPLPGNVIYVDDISFLYYTPIAANDTVTTNEDVSIIIDVQDNDLDPNADLLTTNIPSQPGNGVANILAGDSIEYIPGNNFYGSDSIIYVIFDGALYDTAIVYITVTSVNDTPVANDDSTTTDEDMSVIILVQNNDSDIEGNSLFTTIITNPANGNANALFGDSIQYTPDADFYGIDTIIYTICDNGTPFMCDTAIVVITINSVNDAPVANDDSTTTDEDMSVVILVQNNDSDIEGDSLFTTIITNPANGNANALDADSIQYTPDVDFFGNDTIIYTICDNGTPFMCDTAIVVITINSVNDAPVANDDSTTTDEDMSVVILVQNNDSDIEGDSLFTTIITNPANGNANALDADSIQYTPDADFYGIDTIIYTICDNGIPSMCDTAMVVITINSINDAPVANDDSASIFGDSSIVIDVQNNDTDVEGDSLTTSIFSGPSNGSAIILNSDSIEYAPDLFFVGIDTITYVVCDDGSPVLCDTAIIAINRVGCVCGVFEGDSTHKNILNVYPNPAASKMNFEFILQSDNHVSIKLYNQQGKEVAAIIENNLTKGAYSFYYDLKNLPAGIYMCQFKMNTHLETSKIVVLNK